MNLERELTEKCKRGAFVRKVSGGREYRFYWFRDGRRLAVKVVRSPRPPRDAAVEALAARLMALWTCPVCGTAFTRRGRQRYCSPAHAARARKRKWKERRASAPRRAYRADLRARHKVLRRARAKSAPPAFNGYRSELNFGSDTQRTHYWGV
jgi:hypothetical protein